LVVAEGRLEIMSTIMSTIKITIKNREGGWMPFKLDGMRIAHSKVISLFWDRGV